MQKLRIGVIGLGKDWQNRYLPALRSLRDRFQVVGVYSSVSVLGESAARDLDCPFFEGYRSLIAQPELDAILLLEEDWYQLQPVLTACEFGRGVFCGSEIDIQGLTEPIRNAIATAVIPFMSEFSRRYAPATLRLKELIATRLGRPRLLFCHRRLPSELPNPGIRNPSRKDPIESFWN